MFELGVANTGEVSGGNAGQLASLADGNVPRIQSPDYTRGQNGS
jgi:hypothetical protein